MAEMKTFNGYEVVDARAREEISGVKTTVSEVKSGLDDVKRDGVEKRSITHSTGAGEDKLISRSASSFLFAGSPRKTVRGGSIRITDVEANPHPMKIKVGGMSDPTKARLFVRGKNYFELWDFYEKDNGGSFTKNGVTLQVNDDGSFSFYGTASAKTDFNLLHTNLQRLPIPAGRLVLFSVGNPVPEGCTMLLSAYKNNVWISNLCVLVAGMKTSYYNRSEMISEAGCVFSIPSGKNMDGYTVYPQIELYEGHVDWTLDVTQYATPYEPYHCERYTPSADGGVSGVVSFGGEMTFMLNSPDGSADMSGAAVEVEYVQGTRAAINEAMNSFPYEKYPIPTLYFEGSTIGMNKENAVTLNYRYGERSGSCTLKWQGSSSIRYPKKNYTVKFDEAFSAADGWGEEKKYCLKADWIDFSHCRNVVSAKLWGDVVRSRAASALTEKLTALPNSGAIDGFPCFVVINGEWMGIYNFNIPKDGWMLGMGEGEREAIICADKPSGSGTTWRDFASVGGDGNDYKLEYVTDENDTGWVQTSLNRLIDACLDSNGSDLDSVIGQYLDLDSAIDYYIYCALTFNGDGVGKNHLLSTYDGVKWFFSAYDLDSTFGLDVEGKRYFSTDTSLTLNSVNSFARMATMHTIFNLIYSYARERLVARYWLLRQGALSVSAVVARFYNYAIIFPKRAKEADAEKWCEIPGTDVCDVSQIAIWYGERTRLLDKEIEALGGGEA